IDPSGKREHIFYHQKRSASGGWLDVDANAEATTNRPVENIRWGCGKAPVGTYEVFVHHYANKSGGRNPTDFEVRILYDNEVKEFKGDKFKVSTKQMRHIHTFHLRPELRLAVPKEVTVNQGGKNRLGIEIERKRLSEDVKVTFTSAVEGVTFP